MTTVIHYCLILILFVYLTEDYACAVIGDEGAVRIAEGLEKNTSLKELRLIRVFPPHLLFIHCSISHSLFS
jgi:hypothetical protein